MIRQAKNISKYNSWLNCRRNRQIHQSILKYLTCICQLLQDSSYINKLVAIINHSLKLRAKHTFPMFYRYYLFPSLFTLSGLPGVLVVKNPPANAGTWLQSLVWEYPTSTGQLRPCAKTTEPVLCNKRRHHH